ncbi:MAG: ADP-ribosylglycohydrolase family protein [Anaerolineaceae bacterium]|nr:ADP-ribosylglycohydrolase family protein [Anaerolineaceae bacterium]
MIGAIAGDVIGSIYERKGSKIKKENFPLFSPGCRFTDDSLLTIAVADAILNGGGYGPTIQAYAQRYPDAGFGGMFRAWMWAQNPKPYNSFGNGSAMRVSPVAWAFETEEDVLREAERSAAVTHNHPEGIKGAQATALAVFLARQKTGKEEIRLEINARFGYDLYQSLAEIRPRYSFDSSCQGSVPQAMIAFLDSSSVEDAIRKAISLGGDSDTLAAIAGSIAEAYYGGVPREIAARAMNALDDDLRRVVEQFTQRYGVPQ